MIGGDGSLTGANLFREEWPELLSELVDAGEADPEVAAAHPFLRLVGLVGSIDNDMFGTDMTIGADTALHRITEALDAISQHRGQSSADLRRRGHGPALRLPRPDGGAGHRRELGPHPRSVRRRDDWATQMCAVLRAGRAQGRRQNVVLVAEGAQDHHGKPDHGRRRQAVARGGAGRGRPGHDPGPRPARGRPSAFDRYLGTLLGHAAVEQLLADPGIPAQPQLVGMRGNQVVSSPLMDCIGQTRAAAERIRAQDLDGAMRLRGGSFRDSFAS